MIINVIGSKRLAKLKSLKNAPLLHITFNSSFDPDLYSYNYIFLKMLIPIHTHITFYHLDDVIVTLRGCVQCPDKVQVFPHSKVLIKPDIFELWYKCLYVPWVCKPIVTTREKGDRGLHFSDVIQWRCRLRGDKKKQVSQGKNLLCL